MYQPRENVARATGYNKWVRIWPIWFLGEVRMFSRGVAWRLQLRHHTPPFLYLLLFLQNETPHPHEGLFGSRRWLSWDTEGRQPEKEGVSWRKLGEVVISLLRPVIDRAPVPIQSGHTQPEGPGPATAPPYHLIVSLNGGDNALSDPRGVSQYPHKYVDYLRLPSIQFHKRTPLEAAGGKTAYNREDHFEKTHSKVFILILLIHCVL